MANTATEVTRRFGNFHPSADTRKLCERLKKAEVGEVIPYKEMSGMIGRNTQADGRYILVSAMRILERDEGMFFVISESRGVGVRRVDPNQYVEGHAPEALESVGRKMTRARKRLLHADYEGLTTTAKTKHNFLLSAFGVIRLFTKPKSMARIEEATAEAQKAFPSKDVLRLFSSAPTKPKAKVEEPDEED